jgi:hypothetical protein
LSLSRSDPVLVEVVLGFFGAGVAQPALRDNAAMGKPVFVGAPFVALALGSLAGHPKVDELTHDRSRTVTGYIAANSKS